MHSVIGAPFMQIASGDFPEMARWRGKKHGCSRVGSSYPKMQLVSSRKQLPHPYFQWNHPTYHHEIAFRTSRRAMKIGLLCLQSPCSRLFRMRWRRTWAEGTCTAEERNKLKGLMGIIFSPQKKHSNFLEVLRLREPVPQFHPGGSTYCFSESWGASNVTMESRWEPADVSAKRQAWWQGLWWFRCRSIPC